MIPVIQSAALLIAAINIYVLAKKISRLERMEFRKSADHAMCIAHVAHYVGDSFAAQVLRIAAEDLDSVEGQTKLRQIANHEYKIGGPSVVNLWLQDRADSLLAGHEEEEEGSA